MSIPPPEVVNRGSTMRRGPLWDTLVIMLVIVPLVTLLLGIWFYSQQFGVHLRLEHQRWGEFGDFIGGIVGTVLGAATLIALAVTLLLQARALHDTRHALAHQQQSAQDQLAAAQSLYTAAQEANALTRAAMQQSQALERARNRPHVIFTIDFVREQRRHETITHAYARVRNIGATSAHNVMVTTSPVLRGRLGIDSEPRQPAVVGAAIAFMPPNHEVQDLLAYAPFLFQDNTDEELRYTIHLVYADGNGEQHEEHYSIDLAAQKESLTREDAAQMNLIKLSEQMERTARSLDTIARVLDSPDRSTFMQPLVGDARLSRAQRVLLRDLIALAERTDSPSFLTAQYMGHDRATIKPLGKDSHGADGQNDLRALIEDVEYLCRVGALQGYYRQGSLLFSLTAVADRLLGDGGIDTQIAVAGDIGAGS
jgi:hypothetical protein